MATVKNTILSLKKLRELLEKAFDSGYNNCHDLRTQCIDTIINEAVAELSKDQTSKIYTVEELNSMPVESKFFHSKLGFGIIRKKTSNGKLCMVFNNGDSYYFQDNKEPWTDRMIRIS